MNNNGIDLSQQDIIDNIEWTIARFKSYGIDIHKSSRFYKFYYDYLDLIRSNVFPNNMDELLEGMRDFFEIWQIAKSEEVLRNCKNELIQLFGGTRMPSEDKNQLARNLQYQLFVTSIFSRSEMNVRFEEPDFLFDYMGETYAVAVKRITSKGKVKERTREAEKQILRYGYDGFIAISLDRLLDIDNPFVFLNDIEVLNEATQDILYTLVRENFDQNLFSKRDAKIKGIFLTLGIPSFHPDNLGIGYGFNLQLFPLTNPDENKMEFDRIGKITEQLLIMGLR